MKITVNLTKTSFCLLLITFVLPFCYPFSIDSYILLLCIFLLEFTMISAIVVDQIRLFGSSRNIDKLFSAFTLFIFWLAICFILETISFQSIVRIVQFLGCIAAFYVGNHFPFKCEHFKLVHFFIALTILGAVVYWLISGMPLSNYSFVFTNPNSFGSVLLCWIMVLSIGNTRNRLLWRCITFCTLFLAFVTSSRTALLSIILFIALLTYLSSSKRNNDSDIKKRSILLFDCEICLLLLFVIIYTQLPGTSLGGVLQELSRSYFNKNFFSGRQKVWRVMSEGVFLHPFKGYGLSTLPADLDSSIRYSGHNLYLQTAIQMGMIGLILLIAILRKIAQKCAMNNKNSEQYKVLACIYAIVFHECFEITLTQNMLACGLTFWFIMGIGCNQIAFSTEKNENIYY